MHDIRYIQWLNQWKREYETLMRLNEEIGKDVYPCMKEKDFKTASSNLCCIIEQYELFFIRKYKWFIQMMVDLGPEKFRERMGAPIKFQHYPYNAITEKDKDTTTHLPAVFADTRIEESILNQCKEALK